jgi:hypothetical protein
VPSGAADDQYLNTTSSVSAQIGGIPTTSEPAVDILTVFTPGPPTFTKLFTPDTITRDLTGTLSFVIDNTANPSPATSLSFTDTLPSGVVIADPANASTTGTGGTLTAVAGTGVIIYSGGTVAAGTSCTVQVDITSDTTGVYVNTTEDLTSSLGNSGTATDALTVSRPAALGVVYLAVKALRMLVWPPYAKLVPEVNYNPTAGCVSYWGE